MTPLQAKKITIEVWKYLQNHPKIDCKNDLPEKLFAKIDSLRNECPLCELYVSWVQDCPGCPLADAGECCFSTTSSFQIWNESDADDSEIRRQAAKNIVKIVEAWEIKQ